MLCVFYVLFQLARTTASVPRLASFAFAFVPRLHHGCAVATILLEPLLDAPAAAIATRCRALSACCEPIIYPHGHLRPSYTCPTHPTGSPHAALHAVSSTYELTVNTITTAGVSTTSPQQGTSHPTRNLFQAQSSASDPHWNPSSSPTTSQCSHTQTFRP